MRGEHQHRQHDRCQARGIIPAYAGSTLPLVCSASVYKGSSPHARGAQLIDHALGGREGIIPAYAGSTHALQQRCAGAQGSSPHARGALLISLAFYRESKDHPRIRGEHVTLRGLRRRLRGIIPAYAGSTVDTVPMSVVPVGSSPHTRGARSRQGGRTRARRDHPRIRGEHGIRADRAGGAQGIIPAYAGSTSSYRSPSTWARGSSPHTRGAPTSSKGVAMDTRDHPRIRGERLRIAHRRLFRRGIIPAYAGSTSPTTSSEAAPGDHPRIRGEHSVVRVVEPVDRGIIPAYAGSTVISIWEGIKETGSSPHTRGAPR